MTMYEADQIIAGALVSDASILPFATGHQFSISLSGKEHLDWLCSIRNALIVLKIPVHDIYPKVYGPYCSRGKYYDHCCLQSVVCPTLSPYYELWYPGGVKEVPRGFGFSALSLANTFMGDGNSSWDGSCVGVSLSTHKFSLSSIEAVEEALDALGLNGIWRHRNKRVKSGAGIELHLSRSIEVSKFMDIVEPFMLPSYCYKIKRPRFIDITPL